MTEIRQVEFPEKDLPLRGDVSLLGRLLGEALVEQHGPELLDQVETVRKAAIGMREGDGEAADRLEAALDNVGVEDILNIVKAFSTYLRLANLAEKTHRIRRRREYLKAGAASQRGSLDAVVGQLAGSGTSADALKSALDELMIRPVFTAHPTEATRRSFLEKEYSIVHRLVDRLNPDRTPQEEQQTLDRIRDAINSAWQTSSVPSARPTVADELDNVLFYLTDILYRIVPPFHESLQSALDRHYGDGEIRPEDRDLLRFGSWVGGDMDGNPNVTADTLLESLATQRTAIIRCYLPELRRLGRYLSQSRGVAGFSRDLEERLEAYWESMPRVAAAIPIRHREMPYRCFLQFAEHRLRATLEGRRGGYDGPDGFLTDVRTVGDSLEANNGGHAGLFSIRRLERRIEAFGFHLATLDARQDALLHRQVMGELLGEDDWLETDAATRGQRLSDWLETAGGDLLPARSDAAGSTLEVFRAIRKARLEFGDRATGLYIISMTQGADDVLTTMALARCAGLETDGQVPLDIAPLLETVDDLEAGPAILDALLGVEAYRRHLERRGNRQVIMVGYSDSNKDSGIVSARWSLYEAQRKLMESGRKHGVRVHFFHGRGGTVSRGGGNLVNGIEGAPPGSIDGCFRVTEQGEVINQKYGVRPIALRNLELMTGAVLRHQFLDTASGGTPEAMALMEDMAATARERYQNLVFGDPRFVPYFRSATPIDVIERLNIGSRPASRRSGQGVENLRAIPWVFSWAQVRIGFPGVFGTGTALDTAMAEHGVDHLRNLYENWRFFRGMIADVEMVLAKSTFEIGRRYAQLADEESRPVFDLIQTEFDLARRHILAIKRQESLLSDDHTLARNIRLRNPYADPMHLLQIDLLRRWRESGREDETLLRALKATVNGIALAIQNTG